MKVNAKEAPKGYRAVKSSIRKCADCAGWEYPVMCITSDCLACDRADGCNVIFKKIGRGKDLRGMEVGE